MTPIELARMLASTGDHPRRGSRVLYLVHEQGELEPAGFADAVGDVTTVLDRLDTDGADGLAVQTRGVAEDGPDGDHGGRPVAVVATRDGGFAMAVGGPDGAAADRAPREEDPPSLQECWRVVVHALAALDRIDAIPEPPDDPHPAAYLMAAWLGALLESAGEDASALDRVPDLPDEPALVRALGLPADLRGWDAVHEAVATRAPAAAARLGRNGVAWQANLLLGDPGGRLAALAAAGRVEVADALFAQLTARGWARAI